MPASFLVVGLIRAIEDVLNDCAHEALADTADWYLASQRLILHGVLIDPGEVLTLAGECQTRTVEWPRGVQADLDRWRKLTAVMLAEKTLEQVICEE